MNIISENARVSQLCDIESSTKGSKVVIGAGSLIDSFVKIKFSGGVEDVIIGENCYINSGTVIYSGNGVQLGNWVLIAANCTLAPINHAFKDKNRTVYEQRFLESKGGILIEDDVWIGANSIILDGTIIRKGCIIGAGSIVKGELDSYGIYVGNPLKKVGERI